MEQSLLGTSQPSVTPVTDDERILGIFAHVLTLFAGFLAPLVIYLIKKDNSPFVRDHAKESLNFQLTLLIGYIIGFILMIVLIGFLVLMIIGLVHLVLVIVATVKASDNQLYRYPFAIRFVQ
ncbi:MAG: DUF4870 domain-containing protein [Flavisolibacter sp.]|nr:DUF4870 domain-containing protein [Flavisolibacter sp.]